MKIAIVIIILITLVAIVYFFYAAYYSPSLIGQGYDKEMEKKRLQFEHTEKEADLEKTEDD